MNAPFKAPQSDQGFLVSNITKSLLLDVLGLDVEDRIVPHAMLVADLGADSLDFVELQCALLDRLGIDAPDDAMPAHMTVACLGRLVAPAVSAALAKVTAA